MKRKVENLSCIMWFSIIHFQKAKMNYNAILFWNWPKVIAGCYICIDQNLLYQLIHPLIHMTPTKKLTRKYCISQSVSDDSGSGGMVETLPSRWWSNTWNTCWLRPQQRSNSSCCPSPESPAHTCHSAVTLRQGRWNRLIIVPHH